MKPRYLIQVGPQNFLHGDEGRTVTGTPVLSLAQAFDDYTLADFCARNLRRRGFLGIVCDVSGRPITLETLAAVVGQ